MEAIVHLAGATVSNKWSKAYKQEIIEVECFRHVCCLETLQKNKNQVKQIVSASAIGIYPDSLTNIYHETDLAIDASFLGNVVKQWENEVSQFEKLTY